RFPGDTKPQTRRPPPEGRAKSRDRGLPRLALPETRAPDAPPVDPEVLLGTVNYMAPEQAVAAGSVGAASDLYSLGCTFYFLLTGQAPFEGRLPIETVRAHAQEPPRPLRELRPDVPPAVAMVVNRLLDKDAPGSSSWAWALIEALDAATRRRRPWRWAVAGLLLAAVLAVGLFSLLPSRPGPQPTVPPVGAAPVLASPDSAL